MNVNTLKTTLFLATLGGLLVVAGKTFFGSGGAFIGLALGFAIVGGSYWFSDKLAIKAAGARPVSEAELPEFYSIMRELSAKADMPMPRLYVSPNQQPNAFATGRSPKHAAVAVTEGILRVLDWNELRGVLAHELSHVRNRDILITSVAAAVATGITYVAQLGQFAMFFRSNDDEGGSNIFVQLLMLIVAPIAAMLMQLALSRSREFQADQSGAELLDGDGTSLATALQKIEAGAARVPMNINPAQAQAYIVNPLTGRQFNFAGLFSSHPPTAERVQRLRSSSASYS